MRQDEIGHAIVVVENIALGVPFAGIENLLQIGEFQRVAVDCEGGLLGAFRQQLALPHYLARAYIVAQPQEDRRAQTVVRRPVGKFHLADQLRFHPGHATVRLGALGKRALPGDQRAEILAAALRLGESTDRELLLVADLDLLPLAAALGFVAAGGALGDDPFQAVLPRRFQHLLARAGESLGDPQHRSGRYQLLKLLSPPAQADVAKIVSVQVKQVEGKVPHRGRAYQVRNGMGIAVGDPRLDQVEPRNAFLVEHRDFAVEHRLIGGDVVMHHGQLGVLPLAPQPAAGLDAHLFALHERDGAHAVPLDFEQPLLAARRTLGERRGHRLDRRGHLRLAHALYAREINFRFFFTRRGLPRRQVARDFLLGAPRERAGGVVLDVPSRRRKLVALLDEEPLLPFPAALHVDQREIAVQLLAVQPEFQVAARQLLGSRNAAQQVERAAVPQHHAARSVVARRDVAFEIAVFDGVVFYVRGEMLHRGVERRPLRHGPRLQHAIHLQPEIVVQPRGVVPLHAKGIGGTLALLAGGRFGRFLETAFGGVFFERHKSLYILPFTSYPAL